jgi:hypothetical protein
VPLRIIPCLHAPQTSFRHGPGTLRVIPTVPPVHRFGWLRTRPHRVNPSAQPSITQHQATHLPRGVWGDRLLSPRAGRESRGRGLPHPFGAVRHLFQNQPKLSIKSLYCPAANTCAAVSFNSANAAETIGSTSRNC